MASRYLKICPLTSRRRKFTKNLELQMEFLQKIPDPVSVVCWLSRATVKSYFSQDSRKLTIRGLENHKLNLDNLYYYENIF